MTDNMVERVARAICRAGICGPRDHIEAEVNRNWRKFVLEARAAISAMREPTEVMTAVGATKIYLNDSHCGTLKEYELAKADHLREVASCYSAMIDAALSPPADDGEVG